MIIAMFRKVEWEPILHNKSINIDEIECGGESADTSKNESNINV